MKLHGGPLDWEQAASLEAKSICVDWFRLSTQSRWVISPPWGPLGGPGGYALKPLAASVSSDIEDFVLDSEFLAL